MTEHVYSCSDISAAQPSVVALFVSDVHLSADIPATTEAFLQFLQGPARQTKALYLMGDLFEYWVGDDDIGDPYHQTICDALLACYHAGIRIYWMHGNRDFLVGSAFADRCGLQLLPDHQILKTGKNSLLLTHGDAECTGDLPYMAFRQQVRQPQWQQQFLSQPLEKRREIARQMRQQSQQKQANAMTLGDVDDAAIRTLVEKHGAQIMIHGHTHRPAMHQYANFSRYVLPDWDCDHAASPRGGWLALLSDGSLQAYDVHGAATQLPLHPHSA